MGLRRITQQGLARGWSAWHDAYTDHRRREQQLRALREAGARLLRPRLAGAYYHWRQLMYAARTAQELERQQALQSAELEQRHVAEANAQRTIDGLEGELFQGDAHCLCSHAHSLAHSIGTHLSLRRVWAPCACAVCADGIR